MNFDVYATYSGYNLSDNRINSVTAHHTLLELSLNIRNSRCRYTNTRSWGHEGKPVQVIHLTLYCLWSLYRAFRASLLTSDLSCRTPFSTWWNCSWRLEKIPQNYAYYVNTDSLCRDRTDTHIVCIYIHQKAFLTHEHSCFELSWALM